MVILEDEFDQLSPKWVKIGTHPNFNIVAEDGKLKLLFDYVTPPNVPHYGPAKFAAVYYSDSLNLSNTLIRAKVDMVPKFAPYERPGAYARSWAGALIANKVISSGCDPWGFDAVDRDFKGFAVALSYWSGVPFDVYVFKFDGTFKEFYNQAMTCYPPTELSMTAKPTSVEGSESNVSIYWYAPHFQLDKCYLYLFAFTFEYSSGERGFLFPEKALFDYIKIEKLPLELPTAVFGQALAITIASSLMFANAMLLIRGLKAIK